MSQLNGVFEYLDNVIPTEAEKIILFAEVETTAYEIFYYAFFNDGSVKQCYDLVDENIIDAHKLDAEFEKIANYIRKCGEFKADRRNVVTAIVNKSEEKISIDFFEKNIGLYKIKKNWKARMKI